MRAGYPHGPIEPRLWTSLGLTKVHWFILSWLMKDPNLINAIIGLLSSMVYDV